LGFLGLLGDLDRVCGVFAIILGEIGSKIEFLARKTCFLIFNHLFSGQIMDSKQLVIFIFLKKIKKLEKINNIPPRHTGIGCEHHVPRPCFGIF
jgi:hypothetical protein